MRHRILIAALVLTSAAVHAQTQRTLTADDYARAEKFMGYNTNPLLLRSGVTAGHGFGSEPYMVRRRWDYLVKHLMGAEPPANYEMRGAPR